MKLFDNPLSPFARKVRMVLEHKGLEFEILDGRSRSNHDALAVVNERVEVPTLVDGAITVVNSADIVAYLEHRYPNQPILPQDPGTRAAARAWERCADTVLDAILVDISYWSWADRPDEMPAGLKAAAQRDLDRIFDALERDLVRAEDATEVAGDFICGAFSIADIALFPPLAAR